MTPAMALPSGTAHQTDIFHRAIRQLKNIRKYIAAYRQYRHECDELMELDDCMLKDIGISRVDAIRIAHTPFSEFRARQK
jgi:uncharacterized protein YjiS (DUF1127 family)